MLISEMMCDNKQKQFSCSVLWFQNWNNEERKTFGRVLLEHEQNTSNTLPSMVAHTSYNNTSNTLPILTNTMNRLMLNSNQGLLSNSTFDTTTNSLSNTMDQLSLNQGELLEDWKIVFFTIKYSIKNIGLADQLLLLLYMFGKFDF